MSRQSVNVYSIKVVSVEYDGYQTIGNQSVNISMTSSAQTSLAWLSEW